MRRVFLIGVGRTKVGEHWTDSLRDLFVNATLNAVNDANISLKDIESLYVGNMSSGYLQGQEHLGALMATWLGIPYIAATKVEAACASGGSAFHQAFLAVKSGVYDCVLAGGVEKMTDATTPDVLSALMMADDQEYVASTGITFAGLNALIYRLYMHKYGVKQEDIALFSVHEHKYAQYNKYAQYKNAITIEDVLNSPVVADPIRLLESSPISDGAAAAILCSERKLKEIKKDIAVEVIGSALAVDILSPHEREDPTIINSTVTAAKKAYEMAEVTSKDVDVVEVHDAYSILGIIDLEDLGFAKKGRGVELVKNGEVERDGRIPTNLSGGLKARGHPVGATGIYQITEIYDQLLSRSHPAVQVPNANIGLAHSLGGVGATAVVNILKRVR